MVATRRSCCSEPAGDVHTRTPTIDVVTLGHPLVDVLAHETDDVVARAKVERGAMTMVDAAALRRDLRGARARPGDVGRIGREHRGRRRRIRRAVGFIGRIADDPFGKVFAHDLRSAGVEFDVPPATDGSPTGRCLVIVGADAERTMCTYLGAGAEIDPVDVDAERIVERGGHLPRGLSLGRRRSQGRDPAGGVACAGGRPEGRAHALGPVLCRASSRRVPRADRVEHRHPLRERRRDHDAVRSRRLSTMPRSGSRPIAKSQRSHGARTGR